MRQSAQQVPPPSAGPSAQSPSPPTQVAAAPQAQPEPAQTRPGVDPNQKDIQALIRRERELNRDLLSGLPAMRPSKWPSEAGYDVIDTIPPILLNRSSLLGDSADIDTRDFRVTTGSLATEIFLERCLRNLLVATQEKKAVTLVARPGSVWQMELNCRDGLLDKVAAPSDLYQELEGFEDFAQLSLAMFIGDSLATIHDGTWTFETPAAQSYLELGDTVLKPFELVERWFNAVDKEEVNLEILSRLAQRATERSTSMTIVRDYIDPTRGLTKDTLPASLATLWASYRFSLSDTAFTEITETIALDEVTDSAIVFTLPRKWAPDYASGPDDAGILEGDRVALAYLRESGEFVALASRKGIANYLEVALNRLTGESAGRALDILAKFHCPSWRVATDKSTAEALSKRAGASIAPPRLHAVQERSSLEIFGVSKRGPVRWELEFDAANLIPWQLRIQK
jgi:hypothetical protein